MSLYRIPGSFTEPAVDKQPILLLHSLAADHMIWVFNNPDVAPAFVLARAGYDVWLGDNRGNRFSLGHTSLNQSKDRDYWMFTWEHLGIYDVPAFIERIKVVTGKQKITYMGHS